MPSTDNKAAYEASMKLAMRSVQDRVVSAWPSLEADTADKLRNELRAVLMRARNVGLLKTASNGIYEWVRRNDKPEADEEILGGVKTSRDPGDAHLVRDDGAWIHFKVRVRQDDRKKLTLIAYDFEMVFPEGYRLPWLRLDLNPPDHPNAERELRSHIHPGNDDLQWPAPVMTPQEILAWMLGPGLRPRDPEKPRA